MAMARHRIVASCDSVGDKGCNFTMTNKRQESGVKEWGNYWDGPFPCPSITLRRLVYI